MAVDLVTQEYVDYQLDLNEDSHNRLWDRINDLEQKINYLQDDLYRAQDKINSLESQLERNQRW